MPIDHTAPPTRDETPQLRPLNEREVGLLLDGLTDWLLERKRAKGGAK